MTSKKKVNDSDAPKPVSGAAKKPLKTGKLLTNSLLVVFIVLLLGFLWYQNGSERREMTALAEMIARETGDNYEVDKLFDCGVENERTCPSVLLSKNVGTSNIQEMNSMVEYFILKSGFAIEQEVKCIDQEAVCNALITKNNLKISLQSSTKDGVDIYVGRK